MQSLPIKTVTSVWYPGTTGEGGGTSGGMKPTLSLHPQLTPRLSAALPPRHFYPFMVDA